MADPGQLESALLNVAINARDAMPQGGKLSFTCRAMARLPMELDVEPGPGEATGYVAISIADTGEGMSEAVKERAFEPFFTTKESGRGTGLGLSTVYGFARQSHGAVALRSAPGAGTTITLYLPRIDAGADDEYDANEPQSVPPGLRVLLVEDDPEVRSVVQKFLASMGCEVVACTRAEEALDVLASDAGIGLLLTDILLGTGMRGTALAAAAQTRRPGLPVLLMSGYSSGLLAEPQPWELLRKPYTRAELERAMAKVLNAAQ
jgi:CheY-like chemotaxis protein